MKLASACLAAVLAASPLAAAAPDKAAERALTAADCEPAIKKLWPVIQQMAVEKKHPVTDADRASFVEDCKKSVVVNPHDATMECILAAPTTDAVRVCLDQRIQEYQNRSKQTEAALQLHKLSKNAKTYLITTAMYPKGKAARLPEKPCCPQTGHKCAVSSAWAKDPVWAALDFQIDDENFFQYTYESADGLTFRATATGDVACTGKPVTYVMDGKIVQGNPVTTLTEPK